MMVFFIASSAKASPVIRGLLKRMPAARIGIRFLLALLLCSVAAAQADGIYIKSAELEAGDEAYVLNANFEISLNATQQEALNKGVALYFLAEFELIRPRWYWFDEKIAQAEMQTKLSYNALTRQYRLSAGSLFQNFDSLADAVSVLGRLREKQVLDKGLLQKDSDYVAGVRLRLDTSQLPKPFQINALASREWSLGSEWHRWRVAP